MGNFNCGDVVQLKSGGPVMTVVEVQETKCHCRWFTEKNQLKVGDFMTATLIKLAARAAWWREYD